LQLC